MTTTTERPSAVSTVVDRFLGLIERGQGAAMSEVFALGATLDATVPGWRFHAKGAEAIAKQYAGWFDTPGQFEELDRYTSGDVEFVTYLIAAKDAKGVPYVAHHCHRLSIDSAGLIAADQVFCGGRWDEARQADMSAADAG